MSIESAYCLVCQAYCKKGAPCRAPGSCTGDCWYDREARYAEFLMVPPPLSHKEALEIIRGEYQMHYAYPGRFPCLGAFEDASDLLSFLEQYQEELSKLSVEYYSETGNEEAFLEKVRNFIQEKRDEKKKKETAD